MPTYLIKTKEGVKDPRPILEECKKLIEAGVEVENNKLEQNKNLLQQLLIFFKQGHYAKISYTVRFYWLYPDCLAFVFEQYAMIKPGNAFFDKTARSLLKNDCELYRKVS